MAKQRNGGIGLGWLLAGAIVLEIAAVLLLVPSHQVKSYNAAERAAVVADLGREAEAHVVETANTWYKATLIDTGFVDALDSFLFDTGSPDSVIQHGSTSYVRDRVGTFWYALYALYYRLALICLWVPYLLPIAIPMFVDAIQERRVRQWRFSYVSPLTRVLATRTKLAVGTLLLGAILLPFHVSALAYPILFAVLMVANWVWVANLQKRI